MGGECRWLIPWEYRVASGSPKEFITVDREETIDSTGKTTISKGGTTKFKESSDPDSSYY